MSVYLIVMTSYLVSAASQPAITWSVLGPMPLDTCIGYSEQLNAMYEGTPLYAYCAPDLPERGA